MVCSEEQSKNASTLRVSATADMPVSSVSLSREGGTVSARVLVEALKAAVVREDAMTGVRRCNNPVSLRRFRPYGRRQQLQWLEERAT